MLLQRLQAMVRQGEHGTEGGHESHRATRTGSLRRGARLLRAIARGGIGGARLMDLVSWTGLPRPTIHRVLGDLVVLGWVEQDAAARTWHLGREVYCLGLTAALRHPVARLAETEVAELAAATGRAAFVMVRTGNDALCVLRRECEIGRDPFVHEVGSRAPLGLGAGSMAMLAALPSSEQAAIVAANRPRFRRLERYDEATFRASLRATQASGVAIHENLFVPDLTGIGVAVCAPGGHPLAALSVACASDQLDDRARARIIRALRSAAAALAARLAGDG